MVAKINTGSSLYGAIFYNQRKVAEGSARVIGGNRTIESAGGDTENAIQRTMFAFEPYLAANKNTEKPILHISLNPSPEDSLTDAQLEQLAADYMEKMGYGDQPYTVYLHEDTGRRHIHIVSTCVREDGTKISDTYIHRRSMDACRELEEKYRLKKIADKGEELTRAYLRKADHKKGDLKRQVAGILKSVFSSYKFQSFGEYSAMLSCFNIEAKQVRGEHQGVPYNGIVYLVTDDKGRAVSPPLKSSLFGKRFGHDGIEKRIRWNASEFKKGNWQPKIKNQIALAMADSGGRQKKFINLLKAQGIDTVFRTNDEGCIYGATFIDHNTREVYNGSRIGKEFSANAFEKLFNDPGQSPFEAPHRDRHHGQEQASTIEQLFGMFDFGADGPPPEEQDEDEMMPVRKKKRQYKRKINL
ncbi:MAG: relaxase/mobilization nuclease domain-containing protein [Rikenellaceae bacterium]|jgi:hypothetical protein|nr:relaxase/mobilization nuclease domain-containing protein [Rikenellaceae bacterium]